MAHKEGMRLLCFYYGGDLLLPTGPSHVAIPPPPRPEQCYFLAGMWYLQVRGFNGCVTEGVSKDEALPGAKMNKVGGYSVAEFVVIQVAALKQNSHLGGGCDSPVLCLFIQASTFSFPVSLCTA